MAAATVKPAASPSIVQATQRRKNASVSGGYAEPPRLPERSYVDGVATSPGFIGAPPVETTKAGTGPFPGARFKEDVINKRASPGALRHSEEQIMAVSLHLGSVLDQAYEGKSLKELLAAPPSALTGLTERHNQMLSEVFGIQTIAELGSNKYFALAGARRTRQQDLVRLELLDPLRA